MLRLEHQVRKEHESGITTSALEDLVKGLVEEEVKDGRLDGVTKEELVTLITGMTLVKQISMAVFNSPLAQCLSEFNLSIKDTVFACIFAAANLNVSSEMTEEKPQDALHSKRDFLRCATLAFDYMQLHYKGRLKDSGAHPQHDN